MALLDIAYLGLGLGFLALCNAFVLACERL
jgi:hypothetical protein